MNRHKTEARIEAKVILLQSLLNGPKFIHFGRSPVDAVELGLEMSTEGLVTIVGNYVSITDNGKKFIEDNLKKSEEP